MPIRRTSRALLVPPCRALEPIIDKAVLRFRTADLRRGANDLVIEAAPGTIVRPVQLEALTP